ncbi:MAG: hypothetical protein HY466_01970 [Deltaproteobacteria bacterium]|nr:hypothetical protein [Deltaproteobacteria bacterium]
MGSGEICFNPEGSATYQQLVEELTDGFVPDQQDHCFPESVVPASFAQSSFSPMSAEDIAHYLTNRPYFQTAACLAKSYEQYVQVVGQPIESPDYTPMEIDHETWDYAPELVFNALENYDVQVALSTLAYLRTNALQTPATVRGTVEFLRNGPRLYHCSDYVLVDIYQQSADPLERSNIAKLLLDQFGSELLYFDDVELTHPVPLEQERRDLLYPVFKDLFESLASGKGYSLKKDAAKAMIATGERSALNYLAWKVIDGEYSEKDAAFQALWDKKFQFDVSPAFLKILKHKEGERWTFEQEQIFEAIVDPRFSPNKDFLPIVAEALEKSTGHSIGDADSKALLAFIARCGVAGVPYLKNLAVKIPVEQHAFFRNLALEQLAAMEEPRAQEVLYKLVIERKMTEDAIHALGGGSQSALQTLLKLSNAHFERGEEHLGEAVFYYLGRVVGDPDFALKVFSRLSRVPPDADRNQEALGAKVRLAQNYSLFFEQEFASLSREDQRSLLEAWLTDWTPQQWVVPLAYRVVTEHRAAIDPSLYTFVGEEIIRTAAYQPPEVLSIMLASKDYPMDWKVEMVARNMDIHFAGFELRARLVDIETMDRRFRLQALESMATLRENGVDRKLVDHYALNLDQPLFLREATIDVLKARASAGNKEARAALQRIAGPEAAIREHAREALRSLP